MRIVLLFGLLGCFLFPTSAQTSGDRAYSMTIQTLGRLSIGTSLAEFQQQKPGLPAPDELMVFRSEIMETIGKDGLKTATYIFDADGSKPLYQLILEFDSPVERDFVIEKLFGKANHPVEADHWILGVEGAVVSIGWAFDAKFVLAANLPGTEWMGNAKFEIPNGFEPHKNLPPPTDWPKGEIERLLQGLELQIEAGFGQFASIKGEPIANYFQCNQPISMAELSAIMEDIDHKLLVNNVMTSDMQMETAVDWKAALEKVLTDHAIGRFRLESADIKPLFGKTAAIWNVLNKQNQKTGIQVGLVIYGEKLFSVCLVVLQA